MKRASKKTFIIAVLFQVFLIGLGIAAYCVSIETDARERIDLTELSQKEIERLAEEKAYGFGKPLYTLDSKDYRLHGKFHEYTERQVKGPDHKLAFYTITFYDKNGEEVVMAVKTNVDHVDLEEQKADLIGGVFMLENNFAQKQEKDYTGDLQLKGMVLNDISDRMGESGRRLIGIFTLVPVAVLILLIVRRIQRR